MGRADPPPKSVAKQIVEYVVNRTRSSEVRRDLGCPLPLANVYLGERFGRYPWEIDEQPADKVAYYLRVLEMEAEGYRLVEGTDPDEPVDLKYWNP